jgi:hypothetical protein
VGAETEDEVMYYALVFYPRVSEDLSRSIDAMRRAYDPTCDLIRPHVTVMFPVPDTIGRQELVSHLQGVLSGWEPFTIGFGGLHKSADHWLFLTLTEGESEVKRLHHDLHTGILATYNRWGADFLPHIGLGLFRAGQAGSDPAEARQRSLDWDRYEQALSQAQGLPLAGAAVVDRFQLVQLPAAIVEWSHGGRPSLPDDSEIVGVYEFTLEKPRA